MSQKVGVHVVACRGPGDLSGVQALIEAGAVDPRRIVAVMGKTEGNGCVNDHTRDFAATAWCHFLAPHLGCTAEAVHARVALVMSGGTEGVLSPHFTVFTRETVEAAATHGGKRLVVGIAHTRDFAPDEMGRMAQVEATAAAVRGPKEGRWVRARQCHRPCGIPSRRTLRQTTRARRPRCRSARAGCRRP